MSDVAIVLNNAELALASYANLLIGDTNDPNSILALTRVGIAGAQMTSTQALEFQAKDPAKRER